MKYENINFDTFTEDEERILSSIPNEIFDKLETMKNVETINNLINKKEMSENERMYFLARRDAFSDIIKVFKSFKEKVKKTHEEQLRKIRASKIKV